MDNLQKHIERLYYKACMIMVDTNDHLFEHIKAKNGYSPSSETHDLYAQPAHSAEFFAINAEKTPFREGLGTTLGYKRLPMPQIQLPGVAPESDFPEREQLATVIESMPCIAQGMSLSHGIIHNSKTISDALEAFEQRCQDIARILVTPVEITYADKMQLTPMKLAELTIPGTHTRYLAYDEVSREMACEEIYGRKMPPPSHPDPMTLDL